MNLPPPRPSVGRCQDRLGGLFTVRISDPYNNGIVLLGGVISSEKSHTKVLMAPLFLVTVLVTVRSQF